MPPLGRHISAVGPIALPGGGALLGNDERTLEELYPRIKQVSELCLEEEDAAPMKFVGVQQVEVGTKDTS